MLDIGWGELLVVGVIALIVVGPKDLPGLFKTVGQFMGRARGMAREFQRSMEAAADESGLKEAAQGLKSIDRLNLGASTASARRYAESLVKDIDDTAAGADANPGAKFGAKPAKPAAKPDAKPAPAVAQAPAAVADAPVSPAAPPATPPAASSAPEAEAAPARDPAAP
jgi:sec-independent protein translocase protein TatB